MNLHETCPFCGAGRRAVKDGNQRWVEFECFSGIGDIGGKFEYRSPICRHAELNAAKARVVELEAEAKQAREDEEWAHRHAVPIHRRGDAWVAEHFDGHRILEADAASIHGALRALREKVEARP